MDGFQLLKILKSKDYFRTIPVIMLTARAESKDKMKALRIGVDDYLLKPFDEEELLVRIQNLLANAAQRQIENTFFSESRTNDIEENTITIGEADSEWLETLETLILNNIGKFAITGDWIAQELYISRTQLFSKVKQLTGLTLQQYIKEIRLEKARTYLQNQTYSSVKEVVYAIGLKDPKTFTKNFKSRFGKLPSEFLN